MTRLATIAGGAVAAACIGLALPAAAAAPAWTVDKTASRIGFKSSFGGQAVQGTFRRWDAQIQFDPKALAGSRVLVTVDIASAATGDSGKDEALPTADWFDAARFPRATFAASSFKDLGGGRYQAIGTLSLKGVARPIVLPFTLAISGAQARMNGQVVLNRSAFGVGKGQFASAETVPLEVAVTVAVAARRGR
jgi:polyisoprenoid-binding protein YceI